MAAGLFVPGTGVLHRWHPLTKLSCIAAAFMVAFAGLWHVGGIPILAPLLGAGTAILVLADGRYTFRVWLKRLLLVLAPIFVSLVLVQGFFFPGASEVLLQFGPLALKTEGLRFAATVGGRLILIVGVTLLLLLTTEPADLAVALNGIGLPRDITYLVIAALNLIPRMQARAETILDAQRARGMRTEGSVLVRLRALLPLAGPLIGSALLETDERALALEARAFRAPGPKTSLRVLVDTQAQRLARWAILFLAALLLTWSLLT